MASTPVWEGARASKSGRSFDQGARAGAAGATTLRSRDAKDSPRALQPTRLWLERTARHGRSRREPSAPIARPAPAAASGDPDAKAVKPGRDQRFATITERRSGRRDFLTREPCAKQFVPSERPLRSRGIGMRALRKSRPRRPRRAEFFGGRSRFAEGFRLGPFRRRNGMHAPSAAAGAESKFGRANDPCAAPALPAGRDIRRTELDRLLEVS